MTIDNRDALVGERIHQVMWRKRVTQTELAAVLGVDQAAVNRRLRGRTAWRWTEIVDVAAALGVPVSELIPETALTRGDERAEFRCTPPSGQPIRRRRVHPTRIGVPFATLRPVGCAA